MAKVTTERGGVRRSLGAPLPGGPVRVLVLALAVLAASAITAMIVVVVRGGSQPAGTPGAIRGTGPGSTGSPTASTASPSPTVDPQAAAVIDAYRNGLAAVHQAQLVANPLAPGIDATTTGKLHTVVVTYILRMKAAGVEVRGDVNIVHEPHVVSITSTQAIVRACELDTTYPINAATGAPTTFAGSGPQPGNEYDGVTETLVNVGGVWYGSARVQQLAVAACPAGF